MKNIKLTILGVATLLFALTLNFRHALDDYSVLDNKLHVEVLAQSNSTGGGGTTGVRTKYCRRVDCVRSMTVTADATGCIKVFKKKLCGYTANITVTYPFSGQKENCTGGSEWFDCNACQSDCAPSSGGGTT